MAVHARGLRGSRVVAVSWGSAAAEEEQEHRGEGEDDDSADDGGSHDKVVDRC